MPNTSALVALAALLIAGCTTAQTPQDRLQSAYMRSIAEAAVKTPDSVRTLTPIDTTRSEIIVAHVQPYSTIDTTRFVWVSIPDELRSFCRGKRDSLLALQMALGLPPEPGDGSKVFTFKISPAALFRPCASGPETASAACKLDLPREPFPDAATEHFVLKQIMDSYRSGFQSPGYPFTAMGWSYDWDPDSATHQGVSEYVTRPGAVIRDVTTSTPAAFCNAPDTRTMLTGNPASSSAASGRR
jgi:hypothetical protein